MDNAYLCEDVLKLIFAHLPSRYAKLCLVYSGAKRLLNPMDGWDAIIAAGFTIKITEQFIEWRDKNGLLQSIRDIPAVTEICCNIIEYKWYTNGKFHRDKNPARIGTYHNGEVLYHEYYRKGDVHRVNGPASVNKLQGLVEWIQNGLYHRENGPAFINVRQKKLQYWRRGSVFRERGPTTIVFNTQNTGSTYVSFWMKGGNTYEGRLEDCGMKYSDVEPELKYLEEINCI